MIYSTASAVISGAGLVQDFLQIVGTDDGDRVVISEHNDGRINVHADFLDVPDRLFDPSMIQQVTVVACDGNDHVAVGDGQFSDNESEIDFDIDVGNGDDVIELARPGFQRLRGGSGVDAIRITGSGHHFDLTALAENQLQGVEIIDVVGASPNELTLDSQSVIDSTDDANKLIVIHDEDDTVNYAGEGWQVQPPIFVDGQQHHRLINGDARIETINTLPYQNPLARTDVNFKDGTTALDALLVINLLGRFDGAEVELLVPTSESELPQAYYDVNGSGTGTALDALQVINFIARETSTVLDQDFNASSELIQEFPVLASNLPLVRAFSDLTCDDFDDDLNDGNVESSDVALLEFLEEPRRTDTSVDRVSVSSSEEETLSGSTDEDIVWQLMMEQLARTFEATVARMTCR